MKPAARAALICGLGLLGVHLASLAASFDLARDLGPAVRDALSSINGDMMRFQALLAAAVFVAGACAGLLAYAALRLLRLSTRFAPALGFLGLFLAIARTVALKPALFDATGGGVRAAVQVLLAEPIGPRALDQALLAAAAVFAVAVLVRSASAILRHRVRFAAVAVAAAAALFAVRALRASSHPVPRSIVVLAADSLRPDQITPEVAPNLTALRASAAVADDVFVPIASTTASWVSMLTGLYPHTHGVRDLFPRSDVIHPAVATLPRILGQQGYRTVVVSDYAGESFSRVGLGFDEVDAPPATSIEVFAEREAVQRLPVALGLFTGSFGQRLFPVMRYLLVNADPRELTERAFAHLDDLERGGKPFLLLVFYSVTHMPFAAPMPDARAFSDPAYAGKSRYSYDIQQLADIARIAQRPSDAEVNQVRALYKGALRSFDREVGRFQERLDHDGLRDRVLAVTGDHGENLFEPGATTEHGKWFEGGEAANRTILMLQGPQLHPGPLPPLASGIDFMPTLLQAAGLPAPAGLEGVSLLGPVPPDRTVFAETALWLGGKDDSPPGSLWYPPILELLEVEPGTHALVLKRQYVDRTVTAKLRAARSGKWELIYLPSKGGPKFRLVDLQADPFGERDVLEANPEVAARLREQLYSWMERDRLRWFDAEFELVARAEQ